MDQNETIGKNLVRYRERLGLTQDLMAQYLGISREEVSYYENGRRTLPTRLIAKSASLFGIDEYDLLEEDDTAADVKVALAFRADVLSDPKDLRHISDFRKIVLNYLGMKKVLSNESADTGKESQ